MSLLGALRGKEIKVHNTKYELNTEKYAMVTLQQPTD